MLKSNFSDSNFEAGVDEVGRGSLAGPITAAAVIFPKDYRNDELNDSKKLSEKKDNLENFQLLDDFLKIPERIILDKNLKNIFL